MKRILLLALTGACWVAASGVARADLVYFTSGRSLSVKAYRVEGESLVMTLRTGGEVVCDRAVVERIAPDEVPYPDPTPAASAPAPAPLPAVAYGELIDQLAAKHGVDAKLVRAVIQVESRYDSRARSRKGAMGLMQLMPDTAKRFAVADPYDPQSNLDAGIGYLKSLLGRFEISLALAAYNAGEAAVQRFRGIPPYPETRNYVRDVLRLAGVAPGR